mmetsp:Transcript_13293/g.22564  ORF Transcript_13293/g.22564 Transcript_13293/m.22564 type:complete len:106 (+) Transcript_13293:450-767(+)
MYNNFGAQNQLPLRTQATFQPQSNSFNYPKTYNNNQPAAPKVYNNLGGGATFPSGQTYQKKNADSAPAGPQAAPFMPSTLNPTQKLDQEWKDETPEGFDTSLKKN